MSEAPPPPAWLGQMSFFRTVVGGRAATDLLADPRMHADLFAIFGGFGVDSGPLWEITHSSLLSMNGEQHKRFRALIAPWFTPRAVDWIRPIARTEADRLLDELAPATECEFIGDFATRYVAVGTCTFVGVPLDEIEVFLPFVDLLESTGKDLEFQLDDCAEGLVGLTDYARTLLDRRRSHPTSDMLTSIAGAVTSGDLPEPVAVVLVASLLSAGHKPTITQLGLMMEVMSERPQIWDAVDAGEIEPSPVVEEILRFRSVNQGVSRKVAESFEYDGVHFDEDEQILVRIAAANHDACQYAKPDDFDMEANRGSHLAFGFGPHYCLGAALARAQLQEALRVLTARMHCPTIVASHTEEGGGLRGPSSMKISFDAREVATR